MKKIMILLLCAMAAASVDGQEVTQSIRTVCVPKSSTVFYRVKEMVRMYQFSDTIRYGVLDYYIEDSDAMKTERYYRIIDSFKVKGRPYNGLSLKKIAASVDTARESPGDTVAYEHTVGVRCRMFTWQKDEHVFSCVYDTGSNSIVFLSSPRVHTSATATAWHWIALILIALFAARCGSWSVEQDGEDISFFSATVFFCVLCGAVIIAWFLTFWMLRPVMPLDCVWIASEYVLVSIPMYFLSFWFYGRRKKD